MGTITKRSSEQTATPRRRFRLYDALILLTATVLGCVIIQWVVLSVGGFLSWSGLHAEWTALGRRNQSRAPVVTRLALLTLPVVVAWTLALIPIGLDRPRPRFRRLARQPGMMAACAVGAAIVLVGLLSFAFMIIVRWNSNSDYFRTVFLSADSWFRLYQSYVVWLSWCRG